MKKFDVVILTDSRYVAPSATDPYIENILLEDKLVLDALEKLHLKVTRKSWDDVNFDWSSTKYALFRTTWDYFDRYTVFKTWFNTAAKQTSFINSKALIEWNIDKHYLQDLNTNGIPIPKTLFISSGTKTTLAASLKKAKETLGFRTTDFILKPCISGAAWHTYKFNETTLEQHESIFEELLVTEAMMLQEFQEHIVTEGEISMMVFNGHFTHAVLKVAKPGDFRVQDDYGGTVHEYKPSKEEIAFAIATVNAAPELPMYARVDIFKDNNGNLALGELEIFEPELWFRNEPKAATILAENIKKLYFD